MIDIHSHILWGLDDGAETLEQSLEMLRAAAEAGTTDIVATPHANFEYGFDAAVIGARIQELDEAAGGVPRIHRGCDFHLSPENIEDGLRNPSRYTINGKSYLLVEFPDLFISPSMGEVFRKFLDRGVIPVITHPERNPVLMEQAERLEEWAELGCLSQVTAQSLTGDFARPVEDAAWELVERGLIHFGASDAHDPHDRHPRLDKAWKTVWERMGAAAAHRLFVSNPRAALAGEALPDVAETPRTKGKWFGLWG
jgi:protein-tyrosine phosphatase